MCQSKLSRTESTNQIIKLGVIFFSAVGWNQGARTHGCRRDPGHVWAALQQARPLSSACTAWTWTCFHIHSGGAPSDSLSPRPAWGGETKRNCTVSIKSVKDSQPYLFAFIAVSQHGTVCPVVQVQAFICEGLIRFTAEYAQTEAKTLWSNLWPRHFPV